MLWERQVRVINFLNTDYAKKGSFATRELEPYVKKITLTFYKKFNIEWRGSLFKSHFLEFMVCRDVLMEDSLDNLMTSLGLSRIEIKSL